MLHNQKKGYLITLIYSDIFSMYVLSKHQNRKLLNQIIDSPNISTLNNTSVQVYKHDIIYAFCKVIKTVNYLYLMRW